ncbi:MAG: peptidase M3 [Bacteroidetes bacterium GWF2_42_66]|nr:MAG: peptidase M3 [Bacteroidetes bacterium GWA2_42_15]OFX98533.1 MAG: peptidase M3 [Bacteroidetes bacterium GWE2_42_39]OFY42915.1 MAG: peptidase M3 [Bacteroidetes bacterium GWF2_42_66]HBL74428.1 peptidase M3 [Prolixibacteraceae bacterium]HCR90949.1 peptidase M3 [Prolixibacteraceae bacterium]
MTIKIHASEKGNPLLQPFATLHETAPFHLIKNEHFLPAFEAAIAEARSEIQQIIDQKSVPDFENTIVALDVAGDRLGRIRSILFNLNSAETSDEIQKIVQQAASMLTEFANDISLNQELFEKIKTVHNQKNNLDLSPEQLTLLEKTYQRFVRNGANLSDAEKEKYREITKELSQLSLKFGENVLAQTNAFELQVTDRNELGGLPDYLLESAAQTAKSKNKEGWIFTLQYPSYVPFMKYADNRGLREKMFRAFTTKGNHGNEYDNNEIIRRIVELKLEKARLLGYHSHAEYQLAERMAETPERVGKFLQELHEASRPFAEKEFAEVQDFAEKLGSESKIQRWDWSYYSEKLKAERYGFNEEEVKPYFEVTHVIEGIFGLAKQLYGLSFRENKDIPVYHEDVKPYEVFDEEGNFLSVIYMDFHPREGKRAGAWMTDYLGQSAVHGKSIRPHVSIVMNFTKPTDSIPSLLTFDEFTTFVHEFGHALHGMLSQCVYPSLSGTSVYWDFVELPSQIHENWCYEKEWLDQFAVHYKTGEKIPAKLIEKIVKAQNFQAGYLSERQLSFGMLDMAFYSLQEKPGDIAEFEAKAIAPTELFAPVPGSLQSTSFSHIFAGGYDAGYYSYKWAEVLDADAFSVFQQKGIFNREVAGSFRKNILEKGGSEHPMKLYKAFRKQEPTVDALLKRSGLKE